MQIKWFNGTDNLVDAFTIRKKVFVEEQKVPLENELDDIDNIAKHIVLYDEGRAVATGRVFETDGVYYVGRIAVLKEMRGKNCGALVVRALTDYAFRAGAKEVHLHAQKYAQQFYEKLGYQAYGDVYMEENIEHISMKAENKRQ